ncbi:hypothetical protein WQ54_28405 [Bacillus sp. SA1-12]|uniref:acyl-CoA dehydrogenase family protein n=1 Tax=Bacillus sp. SA1-12 TaxID=1455638 RepID=UPI000626FC89|nr:acyl-CoA dehydrogenase family protein [Bacillus sp. SA1-12]KKI89140.1 hypothetical protein WQ54_28405 [Bacillus sp. SA1-12]
MSLLLAKERVVLETYFPGLDEKLSVYAFMDRESKENECLNLLKETGVPSLMIPKEFGGKGASALDAIYIQRAIGSRSPSLAIAMTMHQFSVASLIGAMSVQPDLERLLRRVAEENLLVASAFAEGIQQSIFSPSVEAKAAPGGILVNGRKKPCTLSHRMDLLTASVKLPGDQLAIIIIPSHTPGIKVNDFWNHWILKGTDTHEVVLEDVFVADEDIFHAGTEENVSPVILNGLIWFEILATASYIGVVSSMMERVIKSGKHINIEKVHELTADLVQSMNALEGIAYKFINNQFVDLLLNEVLLVRESIERKIEQISTQSAKLLGGMNFLTSLDTSYLLLVSQLLTFHPPSKQERLELFKQYIYGDESQLLEKVTI